MEYTISEPNANPKEAVIEKRGHVIKFTLDEIEAAEKYNEKTVKELTAKREVEEAKRQNIEAHHSFVLNLSPQDLLTVWMYQEATGTVKMIDEKLAEFSKNKEELTKELEDIYSQLPELNAKPESAN